MATDIERFMAKIAQREDGCWEWLGAGRGDGYGGFWINKKPDFAHRAAYQLFKEEIPAGKVINHRCGQKWCVNPLHLEAVSQGDNCTRQAQGDSLGRETPRRKSQLQEGANMGWRSKTVLQRFEEHVRRDESGCWLWTTPGANGYGYFNLNARKVMAHRASYELFKGEIPEDADLDHLCRNPACVNPDHLESVSHRENVMRGISFIAERAKSATCIHGHLLAGANLITPQDGSRRCRACALRRSREWRQRRRQSGKTG